MSKAEEYLKENCTMVALIDSELMNVKGENQYRVSANQLTDFHKEQMKGITDEIKKRIGLHEKNQMWNTAKAEKGILELLKRIEE